MRGASLFTRRLGFSQKNARTNYKQRFICTEETMTDRFSRYNSTEKGKARNRKAQANLSPEQKGLQQIRKRDYMRRKRAADKIKNCTRCGGHGFVDRDTGIGIDVGKAGSIDKENDGESNVIHDQDNSPVFDCGWVDWNNRLKQFINSQ